MAEDSLRMQIEALCSSDEEGTSQSTASLINSIATSSPRRTHLLSIVLNQRIQELGGQFEWVGGRFRPLPSRTITPTINGSASGGRGRRRTRSSRAGAALRRESRLRFMNPVRRAQRFLEEAVNSAIRRQTLRSSENTRPLPSPLEVDASSSPPRSQTLPAIETVVRSNVNRRVPPPRPPLPTRTRAAPTSAEDSSLPRPPVMSGIPTIVSSDGAIRLIGGNVRVTRERGQHRAVIPPPRTPPVTSSVPFVRTISTPVSVSNLPPPPGPWDLSPIIPPPRTPPVTSEEVSTPTGTDSSQSTSSTSTASESVTPAPPRGVRTPAYVGGMRPGFFTPPPSTTPRYTSAFTTRTGVAVRFSHDYPLSASFVAEHNPVTVTNLQPHHPPEIRALTMGQQTPPPSQRPGFPFYSPTSPDSTPPPPPSAYELLSDTEPAISESPMSADEREVDDEIAYLPDRSLDDDDIDESVPRLCTGVPVPRWGQMLESSVEQRCVVCMETGHHKVACSRCLKIVMCCSCHTGAYRSQYCASCPLCRYPGPPPSRPPAPATPDFLTRAQGLLRTIDSMREDLRGITSSSEREVRSTRRAVSRAAVALTRSPPRGNLPHFQDASDNDDDHEVIIMDRLDTDEEDEDMDQTVPR